MVGTETLRIGSDVLEKGGGLGAKEPLLNQLCGQPLQLVYLLNSVDGSDNIDLK